jgi:hypothetical protein
LVSEAIPATMLCKSRTGRAFVTSVNRNGLLAAAWTVLLGIACGTSDGMKLDGGGRDVASTSEDGKSAESTGGAAGGTGVLAGTGGSLSTGWRPGTGGATTTTDGGPSPEGRDAPPLRWDAVPTEAGADQAATVDGGMEARGHDSESAETTGRETSALDAPAAERPADVVLVDGALAPGVDLSDCPNPHWLDELISSSSYNRPGSIDRYSYQGAVVFYTPPKYADQYSTLYDRCGTILCHPDGGFTGRGDGQCPGFSDSATGRTHIWPLP